MKQASPTSIDSLVVVGYGNRLTSAMLPAIVPPLFRQKQDSERYIIPPFSMQGGTVFNATEISSAEVKELEHKRQLTLFSTAFNAASDHELWLDKDFAAHYEPISLAAGKLRKIAEVELAGAWKAIAEGNDEICQEHCRTAMCADDRMLEPLLIMAALARNKKDGAGERTMAKLAASKTTPQGFAVMVNGLIAGFPKKVAEYDTELFGRRIMCDMALRKVAGG